MHCYRKWNNRAVLATWASWRWRGGSSSPSRAPLAAGGSRPCAWGGLSSNTEAKATPMSSSTASIWPCPREQCESALKLRVSCVNSTDLGHSHVRIPQSLLDGIETQVQCRFHSNGLTHFDIRVGGGRKLHLRHNLFGFWSVFLPVPKCGTEKVSFSGKWRVACR